MSKSIVEILAEEATKKRLAASRLDDDRGAPIEHTSKTAKSDRKRKQTNAKDPVPRREGPRTDERRRPSPNRSETPNEEKPPNVETPKSEPNKKPNNDLYGRHRTKQVPGRSTTSQIDTSLETIQRKTALGNQLELAAEGGCVDEVYLALISGAEAHSAQGKNALALAARNGHMDAVKLLIEAGADPKDGRALLEASAKKRNAIVHLLIPLIHGGE